MEKRNSQLEHGQPMEQTIGLFARATQVWLAAIHNYSYSITSGEWDRCSKRIARAKELGSCPLNVCNSWGYERLQKSKDSFKDCFENVNIWLFTYKTVYSAYKALQIHHTLDIYDLFF